eukprot:1407541-Lingulodinium_polyedra.AAC.1
MQQYKAAVVRRCCALLGVTQHPRHEREVGPVLECRFVIQKVWQSSTCPEGSIAGCCPCGTVSYLGRATARHMSARAIVSAR